MEQTTSKKYVCHDCKESFAHIKEYINHLESHKTIVEGLDKAGKKPKFLDKIFGIKPKAAPTHDPRELPADLFPDKKGDLPEVPRPPQVSKPNLGATEYPHVADRLDRIDYNIEQLTALIMRSETVAQMERKIEELQQMAARPKEPEPQQSVVKVDEPTVHVVHVEDNHQVEFHTEERTMETETVIESIEQPAPISTGSGAMLKVTVLVDKRSSGELLNHINSKNYDLVEVSMVKHG